MALQPPPPEMIARLRDAGVEAIKHRTPQAAPKPDTSIYGVLEALFTVYACIVQGSEDPDAMMELIEATIAHDGVELLQAPPNDDPEFYTSLVDHRSGKKSLHKLKPLKITNKEKTLKLPDVKLIGEMRDIGIEIYKRRNPTAQPDPETSLYHIVDSCAVFWAVFVQMTPDPEATKDLIRSVAMQDRVDPLIPDPHPEPDFYDAIEDHKGNLTARGRKEKARAESHRASGTKPVGLAPDPRCNL